MEPDCPEWYDDLGTLLFELGESTLSAMYFQRGYQLMKEGQEQRMTSQALKLLENYGLVLYRLGRYEEAVTIYLEALQLVPENKKILETLGELYYLLGGHTQ
ncbi:MAG: hypothetical protein K0Q48_3299 [Bacillota bacterium]|jgi:tetratricopeptide (TPR) repeat protein|nr:hypothetical protein [Bacillota bacterium]